MAAPKHQPDTTSIAKVQALASFGIPEDDIAREIGISAKTLRKYYREQLDTAATKANSIVGQFLWNMATGRSGPPVMEDIFDGDGKKIGRRAVRDGDGNLIRSVDYRASTTAAIFWAKTRLGWRETADFNPDAKDDSADDARERLARAIDRLAAASGPTEGSEAPAA